jgi:hypothetical protein
MMAEDSNIEDLRKSIIEMVDLHWEENHTVMLLASLGTRIRHHFPNADALMPDGLRSFISDNNLAQIISHPDNPVIDKRIRGRIGDLKLGILTMGS